MRIIPLRKVAVHFTFALLCAQGSSTALQPATAPEWANAYTLERLKSIRVDRDVRSPDVKRAEAKTQELLASLHPSSKSFVRTMIVPDSRYMLYGNLFGDGGCYALVDLAGRSGGVDDSAWSIGVGMAQWIGTGWQVRGLWRICPVWRPKGYEKKQNDLADDFYGEAPTQPFWLKLLHGSDLPLVVIAGVKAKHADERFVFTFDRETHQLIPAAFSEYEPTFAGEWLRTEVGGGGNLYPEDEFDFFHWSGNRLTDKFRWTEQAQDNTYLATVVGEGNEIHLFEIVGKIGRAQTRTNSYLIGRDSHSFATVKFVWPKARIEELSANDENMNAFGTYERAYIFEKLTGVSRAATMDAEQSDDPSLRVEAVAKVIVTGDLTAAKILRR